MAPVSASTTAIRAMPAVLPRHRRAPARPEIPGQGTLGQQFHLLQPAIHGRRILGLPGRILIAVLGVAIAVLSVTGVVIWWRKRRARISASLREPRRGMQRRQIRSVSHDGQQARVSLRPVDQLRQLLGQFLHPQGRTDKAALAAVRADQDGCRCGRRCSFPCWYPRNEGNADAVGQGLDIVQRAGQALEAGVEIAEVFLELRGRVAVGSTLTSMVRNWPRTISGSMPLSWRSSARVVGQMSGQKV